MTKPLAVLIVEDSESDALLIVRLLRKSDYKVVYEQVDSAEAMHAALLKRNWDIVISDYSLPQFDGMAALNLLREQRPDIPFIAVSGTMGEETAVAMMKAGAHDYLVKGNLARLVPAIERELEQAVVRRERLQAEEELQASEARYRLIFDTSLDGILLTAPDGAILAANRSACLIFDRTEAELKQVQRSEILEISDPVFDQALEGAAQKGNYFGELIMIRRDGTKIPGEVSTARFKDKDGSLRTSMILRDITGRKRREEQLAESEARYKGLFDNSGTSIHIIGRDGKYLQVNKKAAENFGRDARDVEGKSIKDLLPAQTAQKYLEDYRSLIKSGGHR